MLVRVGVRDVFLLQWQTQGEGPGAPPPPPIRPDACLRLKFLHRQDRISLFYCLIFLMKRTLHFVTKLNSRDIQKFNWFWVPFYGLNQSLDPLIKISWIRPCLVRFILNLSYVNNGKLSLYQLRYNITTFCWPSSFY